MILDYPNMVPFFSSLKRFVVLSRMARTIEIRIKRAAIDTPMIKPSSTTGP